MEKVVVGGGGVVLAGAREGVGGDNEIVFNTMTHSL